MSEDSCNQCQQQVIAEDKLKCQICENIFRYKCSGYNSKDCRKMKSQTKTVWKCKQCVKPKNKPTQELKENLNPNVKEILNEKKRNSKEQYFKFVGRSPTSNKSRANFN